MSATKTISLDLWGTIFDFRAESSASAARRQLVKEFAHSRGVNEDEAVDRAYADAARYFYDTWESKAVTISPRERLAYQLQSIGINPEGDDFAHLVSQVEEAALRNLPKLAPDILPALEAMFADYSLVLISDTGLTVGRIVRQAFEDAGIAKYFSDYSFSDENGCSKPNRIAFESVFSRVGVAPENVWHVGDTERTDIAGAKAVGASACLYIGMTDGRVDGTEADFVLNSWSEIDLLLRRIRED
jgi:HAD superfamily hydrolase (TIGR01549 family)